MRLLKTCAFSSAVCIAGLFLSFFIVAGSPFHSYDTLLHAIVCRSLVFFAIFACVTIISKAYYYDQRLYQALCFLIGCACTIVTWFDLYSCTRSAWSDLATFKLVVLLLCVVWSFVILFHFGESGKSKTHEILL